ncbi:MAG: hypothetical protein U1F43_18995 [Myxococcota bacterium]
MSKFTRRRIDAAGDVGGADDDLVARQELLVEDERASSSVSKALATRFEVILPWAKPDRLSASKTPLRFRVDVGDRKMPSSSGSVGASMVICGGSRSTSTGTSRVAVRPDASVTRPCAIWSAPVWSKRTGWLVVIPSGQSSLPLKVTVAGTCTQPASFGVGSTVALMVGSTLSMPKWIVVW